MRRIGMIVRVGMLVALTACSGGSSNTSLSSSPTSPSESRSATALDGVWVADLDASDLENRGFTPKQIRHLQHHDEWSSHQVNEISISGDAWILSQGMDGDDPIPTNDLGHLSMTNNKLRLDDGTIVLVLRYRIDGDTLQMSLLTSTSDETPLSRSPTSCTPPYSVSRSSGRHEMARANGLSAALVACALLAACTSSASGSGFHPSFQTVQCPQDLEFFLDPDPFMRLPNRARGSFPTRRSDDPAVRRPDRAPGG